MGWKYKLSTGQQSRGQMKPWDEIRPPEKKVDPELRPRNVNIEQDEQWSQQR